MHIPRNLPGAGALSSDVVRSHTFFIQNAKSIIVEATVSGGSTYYNIRYPAAATGWKEASDVRLYTPVLMVRGMPQLTKYGNLGAKFSETKDKAKFKMSTAAYHEPPHAYEKHTTKKGREVPMIPGYNKEQIFAEQERFIPACREANRTVFRQLFDGGVFDGESTSEIRNEKYKEMVKKLQTEEHAKLLETDPEAKPPKKPESAAAYLKEKDVLAQVEDAAFEEWFKIRNKSRKHLCMWKPKKDTDRANPKWKRKVEIDGKLKDVEPAIGWKFKASVFEPEKPERTASGSDVPRKIQLDRLAKNHPACAAENQIMQVEKKKQDPNKEKQYETLNMLYMQVPIRMGLGASYHHYPPMADESPVISNALVQVLTSLIVANTNSAQGCMFGPMEEIIRIAEGVKRDKTVEVYSNTEIVQRVDEHGHVIYSDDEDEDVPPPEDTKDGAAETLGDEDESAAKERRVEEEHSQHSNDAHGNDD